MKGGKMGRTEVTRGVYQVGGSEISHGDDASVFLVRGLNQAVLIDAGAGRGSEIICLHTPGHTPGSISPYLDRGGQRILVGQDIHGPFLKEFGANLDDWRESMHRLLEMEADILCEGHFGIFNSRQEVRHYIENYLRQHGRWGT